mmetsp:Transcript_33242/g.41101  ORF Transcript_33242/g.41101 Transcript_33242/m.41101 type:complete len:81 (+) Transcript_33242:287-529(+)
MDISVQDSKQRTPLHWAVYSQSHIVLEFILAHKQNLELKDIFGYTALHKAVTQVTSDGSTMIVKTLIVRGAMKETLTDQG